MAWAVEISAGARKALSKLDPPAARAILRYLHEKIASASNPHKSGKALVGSTRGNFWRWRAGVTA
jgi:mRNA interferase RelE/StbE